MVWWMVDYLDSRNFTVRKGADHRTVKTGCNWVSHRWSRRKKVGLRNDSYSRATTPSADAVDKNDDDDDNDDDDETERFWPVFIFFILPANAMVGAGGFSSPLSSAASSNAVPDAIWPYGSKQSDVPALNRSLSHFHTSSGMRECSLVRQRSERRGVREWVSAACKWANGRVSGPVFSPGFLVVLDYSAWHKEGDEMRSGRPRLLSRPKRPRYQFYRLDFMPRSRLTMPNIHPFIRCTPLFPSLDKSRLSPPFSLPLLTTPPTLLLSLSIAFSLSLLTYSLQ